MTDALLMFSGGLDSTVLLAHAIDERQTFRVLQFDYRHRPQGERDAAAAILDHYGIDDTLTVAVPAAGDVAARGSGDAEGWLPLRNLWFHVTAALVARRLGAGRILAAHLDQDALDFPDARPDYFRRIQGLIDDATLPDEPPIRIELPFQGRSKLDVARLGARLDAPLPRTWGCYRDQPKPCGECAGCTERAVALSAR